MTSGPVDAPVVGVGVVAGRDLPAEVGLDWAALEAAGFAGKPGQVVSLPSADGPVRILVGGGTPEEVDADQLRDAAANVARRCEDHPDLALVMPPLPAVTPQVAAQAVVEGALLARYRYDVLKSGPTATPFTTLTVVVDDDRVEKATEGARCGHGSRHAGRA